MAMPENAIPPVLRGDIYLFGNPRSVLDLNGGVAIFVDRAADNNRIAYLRL